MGNMTSHTDPLGRTATWTYDDKNNLTSETDPLSHTATYEYDIIGNLIKSTDPCGKATQMSYDTSGLLLSHADPLGHTTTYVYSSVGDMTSKTDPLGNATSYAYDSAGRMVSTTDPLSNSTTYIYDACDRPVSSTDPLGNTISYSYDPVGNKLSETEALGRTTSFGYNERDELASVTDAMGGTISYAYDPVGNKTSVTDANDHTTTMAYDALNRLATTTDPLGNSAHISYDAEGRVTTRTDANGAVIAYSYDAVGQLSQVSYQDGATVSVTCDAAGRKTQMTDSTGTTNYTYDNCNHLLSVTYPSGETVSYAYDDAGNRTALIYPNGETVAYTYDGASRLSLADWEGRTTAHAYDAAGRLSSIIYPNGVISTYVFDLAGRLLGITYEDSENNTIAAFSYTLDAVGNRTQVVDGDGTTAYMYDNLDRLTQVTYPGGRTQQFSYDLTGNRTSLVDSLTGNTTYAYNEADQMLQAGGDTFTYDANGNTVSKDEGGTVTTFTYDGENRLVQVSNDGSASAFTYNGEGLRVAKSYNGQTTQYVSDVNSSLPVVLEESNSGGISTYQYGLSLLAQVDPTGSLYYYHADGLGSVRSITDSSASEVASYSYEAFGALLSSSGTLANPFKFTCQQEDETELYYLRSRYYEPEHGRFMSRDTFGSSSFSLRDTSKYLYCDNNPVKYIDPSGYCGEDGSAGTESQKSKHIDYQKLHTGTRTAFSGYGSTIGFWEMIEEWPEAMEETLQELWWISYIPVLGVAYNVADLMSISMNLIEGNITIPEFLFRFGFDVFSIATFDLVPKKLVQDIFFEELFLNTFEDELINWANRNY